MFDREDCEYVSMEEAQEREKASPLAQAIASAAAAEDALCEQDGAVAGRLAALEDAICEIDSTMNAKQGGL